MRGMAAICALSTCLACGGGGKNSDEHKCNDGGSGNELHGSYCEDTPMNFTDVRFLTIGSGLRIEYDRTLGSGSEKTLQIILDGSRYVFMDNTDIPLLEDGGLVRRILADAQEPQNLTVELDPMKPQKIHFDKYNSKIGSPVSGSFGFLFKSGRTLDGSFTGTLESAMPSSPDAGM
jgi:hypothetical protein